VHDITSSAFYWPFPFADGDPNSYVHDSRLPGQVDGFPLPGIKEGVVVAHYRSWGFTQEDNFCRVDLDKAAHSAKVQVFNRDGKVVKVTNERGELAWENVLRLTPWD
jgi:alkaline phosphatase D